MIVIQYDLNRFIFPLSDPKMQPLSSLKHVLFVLKALEYEISLLVLKLLDPIVGAHVIELADLVALNKLLVAVIQVVVLFLRLSSSSIWVKHVRA